MKGKLIVWLPFALVAALLVALFVGLSNSPEKILESQMVGKDLPQFALDSAFPGQRGVATSDFKDGKPRLLNVFASWCAPCVAEIPMLLEMKNAGAQVVGVAVHDSSTDLAPFLAANGNPYAAIGMDFEGKAQIGVGSTRVPETFVIDGNGKIIYQHIGLVTEADKAKLLGMLGIGQ